jgi:hypothetical protein
MAAIVLLVVVSLYFFIQPLLMPQLSKLKVRLGADPVRWWSEKANDNTNTASTRACTSTTGTASGLALLLGQNGPRKKKKKRERWGRWSRAF